jgi:hypothetical protein
MSDLFAGEFSAAATALRMPFQVAVSGQRAFMLTALAFIAAVSLGVPNSALLSLSGALQVFAFVAVSAIYGFAAHIMAHFSATGSLDASVDHGFKRILARGNVARGGSALLGISALVVSFASFKAQIPHINPYSWDAAFASMDKTLHFGTPPWRWIESAIGYGQLTIFTDHIYYLWFPVTFGAAAIAALTPGESALRHRFLLSFALSWIVIGCLFATILSSAGPLFYDRLTGASDFAGLTSQLETVNRLSPLRALEVRDMLWMTYTGQADSVITGISAMPSMHNAMCVLIFMAARHVGRWLAAAAAVYGLAIFIGSVHLGWHYAIDGYVAAALTIVIWKVSGMIVNGRVQLKRAKNEASADALS